MRRSTIRKPSAWLVALLGLALVGPTRAAVMTGNVTGTTGSPAPISYSLSQDAASLQVKIFTENGTLVRTMAVSDPTKLAKGRQSVDWDLKNDQGQRVPEGNYYAQVETTGAAVAALTELFAPVAFRGNTGQTDGRIYYAGDANRVANSPYHNLGIFPSTNSSGSGMSGFYGVDPVGQAAIAVNYDGGDSFPNWRGGSVLADGAVVLTGGVGNIAVLQEDGTLIKSYFGGDFVVRTRDSWAIGPSSGPHVYYVEGSYGDGTTGSFSTGRTAADVGAVSFVDLSAATPELAMLAPATDFPTGVLGRTIVVKEDETALWVAGWSASPYTAAGAVMKYVKTPGSGTPGTWTKDTSFSFTPPAGIIHVALSPDESILWVAVNPHTTATPAARAIIGLDPNTGAEKGAAWKKTDLAYDPQSLAVTDGGNIYVTSYGTTTGTTSRNVSLFAPPDTGSSDITRGKPFYVFPGSVTEVQITNPVVTTTDTSATVTWTTNVPSTTSITWSADQAFIDNVFTRTDATLTREHSITIPIATQNSPLRPNATYYFTVKSTLPGINEGTYPGPFDPPASLTTLKSIDVQAERLSVTQTSATLGFTTNVAASAVVKWGSAPGTLDQTVDVAAGTTHTATLDGLKAGTTYYYTLDLSGAGSAPRTTPVASFTTQALSSTAASVTHNSAAQASLAHRVNVAIPATGLASLQKQGVPGAPVAGPDSPKARWYSPVVAYNGYIYLIGGRATSGTANTATEEVYYSAINPTTGDVAAWQTTTKLPALLGTNAAMAFAYNGFVYVVGGLSGSTQTTSRAVYYAKQNADGTLGTWGTTTQLPAARYLGGATVVDGYVVVSGGAPPETGLPTNYIAQIKGDGTLGTWWEDRTFQGRWFNRIVANNHTVYGVSGLSPSGAPIQSVDIAGVEPEGGLTPWQRVTDLPGHEVEIWSTAQMSSGTVLTNGKIVAVGGRTYSLNNTTWSLATTDAISYAKLLESGITEPFNQASSKHVEAVIDLDAAAYNGNIYVNGGRTASSNVAASAKFTRIPMVDDPNGGYAFAGTFESPIIDLGALSNLENLTVNATGTVEVRYRYGNESGEMSAWYALNGTSEAISGGARYFQYQLVLKGNGSGTPVVNSVTLTTKTTVNPITKGDVNGDHAVNAEDVMAALRIAGGLVGATTVSPNALAAGDVAGGADGKTPDGKITIEDALRINRSIQNPPLDTL